MERAERAEDPGGGSTPPRGRPLADYGRRPAPVPHFCAPDALGAAAEGAARATAATAAETARSAIEESADALGQLEVTLPHARRAGGGVGALSASESGAPALVVLRGLARVVGRPARASFACGHPRGCTTCHQRGRVKLAALSPLEPDARQNTSHGRKQKLALASFLAHTQGFDLGTGGNFNGSRARFVPTRQRREPTHRNKTPNKVGRKFPTTSATSGLRPVGTATPPKGVQARMC